MEISLIASVLVVCSVVGTFLYFILRLYVKSEIQDFRLSYLEETKKTESRIQTIEANQREDREFKREIKEMLKDMKDDMHKFNEFIVRVTTLNDSKVD